MLAETPERLRQKAQACRRLAATVENVMREALWLDRADHWEQLAKEAEKLRLKKAKLSADYFGRYATPSGLGAEVSAAEGEPAAREFDAPEA